MPNEDEIFYWLDDDGDGFASHAGQFEAIPMLVPNDGSDGRPVVEPLPMLATSGGAVIKHIPMLASDDGSDGGPVTAPIGPQRLDVQLPYQRRPFTPGDIPRGGRLGPGQWPDLGFGDLFGRMGGPTSSSDLLGTIWDYLGRTPRPGEGAPLPGPGDLGSSWQDIGQDIGGGGEDVGGWLGTGGTTPEGWNYGIPFPGRTGGVAQGGFPSWSAAQSFWSGAAENFTALRDLAVKLGGGWGWALSGDEIDYLYNLAVGAEGAARAAEGNADYAERKAAEKSGNKPGKDKKDDESTPKGDPEKEHQIKEKQKKDEEKKGSPALGVDTPGDVDPQTPYLSMRMRRRLEEAMVAEAWARVLAGPSITGDPRPIDPPRDVIESSERGGVSMSIGEAPTGRARAVGGGRIRPERGPVTPFEELVGPGRIGFGGQDPRPAVKDPFLPLYDPARRGEQE